MRLNPSRVALTLATCLAVNCAHAQLFLDVPTVDAHQSSQARATSAAIMDSATGLMLLGVNTTATVMFGPLGVAASAVSKFASSAYTSNLEGAEKESALNSSAAWWTGGAVANMLLLASAAQPLALIGGLTAGYMSWSGPGSYTLSSPPPPPTEWVPNIEVKPNVELEQAWAIGTAAEQLKQLPVVAPSKPLPVIKQATPVKRKAYPVALEF